MSLAPSSVFNLERRLSRQRDKHTPGLVFYPWLDLLMSPQTLSRRPGTKTNLVSHIAHTSRAFNGVKTHRKSCEIRVKAEPLRLCACPTVLWRRRIFHECRAAPGESEVTLIPIDVQQKIKLLAHKGPPWPSQFSHGLSWSLMVCDSGRRVAKPLSHDCVD